MRPALSSLLQQVQALEPRVPSLAVSLRERSGGEGRCMLDGALREVLSPPTHAAVVAAAQGGGFAHGLERCAAVAGMGAAHGATLAAALGVRDAGRARAAVRRIALWALFVAFFDHLCDEYGSLRPLLRLRMPRERLRAALRGEPGARFTAEDVDPALLRLVLELADALCPPPRGEAAVAWPRWLQTGIDCAYAAEWTTAESRFGDGAPARRMRGPIWASSALPVWIMGNFAALAAGVAEVPRWYRPLLCRWGELMWLIDDLVDIENDVATDGWNAVHLLADACPGALAALRAVPAEGRMGWLRSRGLEQALAQRLLQGVRRLLMQVDAAQPGTRSIADAALAVLWLHAHEGG